MDEKTIKRIKKLQREQSKIYEKYSEGEATKKDIKRFDEITNELLEIQYE
jgi:cell fate (sporulation/competence/biofilm development) regulator YmcA (YheA/YmcA/DUF963 family)